MYTGIRIEKKYGTHLECVIKYYSILNVLNSLKLTNAEVNILAFTCVYGNVSSIGAKQDFLKTFGMTLRSLENATRRLVKRGFLIKEEKKIVLNKQLHIEFETLILNIHVSS